MATNASPPEEGTGVQWRIDTDTLCIFISYLLEPGPSRPNIIPKHVAPSYQILLSELRVNHFGYRRSRLLTEFVGARGRGRSVTELTYSDPRQVIMHHASRVTMQHQTLGVIM